MKYKYALNSKLKGIIEWQLEHYPEDIRTLDNLTSNTIPSHVSKYDTPIKMIHNRINRTTEDIALRIYNSKYIHHLELSCGAISRTLENCSEIDVKLVKLIYWQRSYTPEGAGLQLGLSRAAVYQRLNTILGTIAIEMGYIDF